MRHSKFGADVGYGSIASFERFRYVCFTPDSGRMTATQRTDALGQNETNGTAAIDSGLRGQILSNFRQQVATAVRLRHVVVTSRRPRGVLPHSAHGGMRYLVKQAACCRGGHGDGRKRPSAGRRTADGRLRPRKLSAKE